MLFIVSCPALTVFHLQGTRLESDGPNERWWLCFLSEKSHLSHDFGRGLCSRVPRELGEAQGKAGWSGCELQPGGRKTTCSSLQLWPRHSENVPAVPVLHLAHIRTGAADGALRESCGCLPPAPGSCHWRNRDITQKEGEQEEKRGWDNGAGVGGQSGKQKRRPENRA